MTNVCTGQQAAQSQESCLPRFQSQLVIGHYEGCHRCHHPPGGQIGLVDATYHWEGYHTPTVEAEHTKQTMNVYLQCINKQVRQSTTLALKMTRESGQNCVFNSHVPGRPQRWRDPGLLSLCCHFFPGRCSSFLRCSAEL